MCPNGRIFFLGVLGSGLGRGPPLLRECPPRVPLWGATPPQHKHLQITTVRATEAPDNGFRGTFELSVGGSVPEWGQRSAQNDPKQHNSKFALRARTPPENNEVNTTTAREGKLQEL